MQNGSKTVEFSRSKEGLFIKKAISDKRSRSELFEARLTLTNPVFNAMVIHNFCMQSTHN